eukprot:TRINITY_DN3235_c1_g1_i2.p1 TRINITY_DN3235_c1_g1~~TRINITY_DN3235_c1_g1_i2.p1  ORF type:complete len:352 (-),score=108.34 TRINITY_DN3235_c1_g1_i2:126-1181(-)
MNFVKSWLWSETDRATEFITTLKTSPVDEIIPKIETEFANLIVDEEGGETALHFAVQENYVEVVEALLAKGADANAKDLEGITPLHMAAGHNNTEIISLLLDNKADINASNAFGSTPLHIAAFQGQLIAVEALVEKGADSNCLDQEGRTPLHGAALKGELTVCESLVKHGKATVDIKEKDGKTALQTAVFNGHLNVVKFLIDHGADVNTQTNDGETPLHRAVSSLHPSSFEIVALLLEKGSLTNKVNKDNRIPLQVALLQTINGPEEDQILVSKIQNLIEKTEVSSMFQGVGISEEKAKEYQKLLVDNDIDQIVYVDVDEKRLENIGISSHGHRMKVAKVLQFIGKYTRKI